LLGHRSPILQSAQSRIAERMNWRAISFLLEGTVFLLIGLQARRIISGAAVGSLGWGRVLVVCGGTLVGVIVLRLLWVFAARYLLVQAGPDGERAKPSWRYTLLLGWAGMRGVVTLAAAFILPASTPHRNTLLLVAFTVTAGTLFLQGLSMPLLAKWLGVPGPDPMADALARANLLHQASRAGLDELESLDEDDPHDVSEMLRDRVERRDLAAWERVGLSKDETPSEVYARRRQLMIDAERQRVLEVRDTGKVAHEVVEEVLAMLDVEESMLDYTKGERQRMRSAVTSNLTSLGGCEDLREPRDAVQPKTLGQCDACLEERSPWVHLRLCLVCGNVACCDSSPNRHATRHFEETGHPVMCSAEPGEHWRWCYVHEITG
jgi:monovalent cation/hydrogen antiporter